MALLPDPATAGLYAAVVFLISLGVLVVFVETVSLVRFLAVVVGCMIVAVVLIGLGEVGVSLLPVAVGGAFVANHVFEWMTTR